MNYKIKYNENRKKFEVIREDTYCDVVIVSGSHEMCQQVYDILTREENEEIN